MKYLRSTTFGFKDIGIRKSEFVTNTQFLYICLNALKADFSSIGYKSNQYRIVPVFVIKRNFYTVGISKKRGLRRKSILRSGLRNGYPILKFSAPENLFLRLNAKIGGLKT